jgi:hypothetical protein
MRFPKGKYNGLAIDGIDLKFQITLLDWRIYFKWTEYDKTAIFVGCFKLWIGWHYENRKIPPI